MKKTVLIAFLTILPAAIHAVPAYPGSVTFKQHDGTSFKGMIKGDEWFNWIEDTQGKVVVYNTKSKQYEYGILKKIGGKYELLPSGIKAVSNVQNSKAANAVPEVDRETLYEILKEKRDSALKYMQDRSN